MTAREVVLGYALAVAVRARRSRSSSTSRRVLRRALLPILVLSQTVPTVLLAPILAILFGFGLQPKLIVVAVVCFFPIVVNAVDGLRSADAELVRMMRTLDASRARDLPPRRVSRRAAGDLLRRARSPRPMPRSARSSANGPARRRGSGSSCCSRSRRSTPRASSQPSSFSRRSRSPSTGSSHSPSVCSSPGTGRSSMVRRLTLVALAAAALLVPGRGRRRHSTSR